MSRTPRPRKETPAPLVSVPSLPSRTPKAVCRRTPDQSTSSSTERTTPAKTAGTTAPARKPGPARRERRTGVRCRTLPTEPYLDLKMRRIRDLWKVTGSSVLESSWNSRSGIPSSPCCSFKVDAFRSRGGLVRCDALSCDIFVCLKLFWMFVNASEWTVQHLFKVFILILLIFFLQVKGLILIGGMINKITFQPLLLSFEFYWFFGTKCLRILRNKRNYC